MALETGIEPNQDHPQPQSQQQPQQQQRAVTAAAASGVGAAAPQQPEAESTLEVVADTTGDALFDNVHQTMERFAATRIGQFVIERGDRILRTIEDTAKWSLPNEKSERPLHRPLSWLPFLALIITLRQLRFWLSVGALLIGNGPVTAQELVYFVQTRRRKLRCIRIHGLKAMRQRELERNPQHSASAGSSNQDAGFMVKLGKLLTVAMCRPGYLSEPARRLHVVQHDEACPQRHLPLRFTQKRQREDDTPEADLSCSQMLAQYANENSDDDSDYMPNREEDESTGENSSSSDSQSEYQQNTRNDETSDAKSSKEQNANAEATAQKNGGAEQSAVEADMNMAPKNATEAAPKMVERETAASTAPPPSSSQTPLENGPSNGGENREADVDQTETRILKTYFDSAQYRTKNISNGHAPMEKLPKSSEIESDSTASIAAVASTATVVRTRSPPLLPHNNHILNAIDNDECNIATTTTDGYNDDSNDADADVDDDDDDDDKRNIAAAHTQPNNSPTRTNINSNMNTNSKTNTNGNANNHNQNNEFNVRPFPPCSTASSSSSSSASFVMGDDLVADSESYPDAPTPTPSLDSSYLDSANALNTASSSEDVFYSPIGSPPNFNAFHKSTNQPINQPINPPFKQSINKSMRFRSADGHSTPKTRQVQAQQPEDEIPSTSQKSKQFKTQTASLASTDNTNYEPKSHHFKQRNRRYRR